MKISRININNSPDFGLKCKTEDVLMLATGYPYKRKDVDKIIKNLAGIDIYSTEYGKNILPDADNSALVTFAIEDVCSEKVRKQNPKLAQIREEYTTKYTTEFINNSASKENWFETKVKQLGKTMDIDIFTITADEVKQAYQRWVEVIEEVQKMIYEEKYGNK